MKICIQDKKKFNIVLPNSFLKVIGWGFCLNMDKEEKKATQRLIKDAYEVLKQYKKENGSLALVDVESGDGDIVKIIL